MKFALVMPTWIRQESRALLANECFRTLMQTEIGASIERPLLILLIRPIDYQYPLEELRRKFSVSVMPQHHEGFEFYGCDQPMVYGCQLAVEMGAEYLVHLGDDTLFNPHWLTCLKSLIERRPHAVAWSVYRSAHVAVHRTIREEEVDVLVRSINGNGLTVSVEEWKAWGMKWDVGGPYWLSENGTTLDMHHLTNRLGERWVSKRSWIEHAGREGTHVQPHIPEYAIDFVGTES